MFANLHPAQSTSFRSSVIHVHVHVFTPKSFKYLGEALFTCLSALTVPMATANFEMLVFSWARNKLRKATCSRGITEIKK